MIEINLIPDSLRKKRKSSLLPFTALSVPREAIIGLVGGLIVLLVLVHVLLQVLIFVKFAQHAHQKSQWDSILPEKKKLDVMLNDLRSLDGKLKAIEQITTGERLSWAIKLNDISDSLPKGIWLNKITLGEKVLLIDGSVVSREKGEIVSVGNFVTNLKRQKGFVQGLQNVEMGTIQKRKIKSVEVADFLITVKLQ